MVRRSQVLDAVRTVTSVDYREQYAGVVDGMSVFSPDHDSSFLVHVQPSLAVPLDTHPVPVRLRTRVVLVDVEMSPVMYFKFSSSGRGQIVVGAVALKTKKVKPIC